MDDRLHTPPERDGIHRQRTLADAPPDLPSVPPPTIPFPPPAPPKTAAHGSSLTPRDLDLRFLGRGSEYFGIWIVNLLLIIVTLGLYWPWARARKLRWFAENTELDGRPFHFAGTARQMFGGFVLGTIGLIAYLFADQIHPALGVVTVLVFALVWPWLFTASLRFRLARTEWRGLPFAFTGKARALYTACLLPGGVVVAASAAAAFGAEITAVLLFLAAIACIPFLLFAAKRHQHAHLAYAGLHSAFDAGVGAFYGLVVKTLLVGMLAMLLALIPIVVALGLAYTGASLAPESFEDVLGDLMYGELTSALLLQSLIVFTLVAIWIAWSAPGAYFASRLHGLVWSHTTADGLQLPTHLPFRAYWWLLLKNRLLIVLTLGLYTPFAQVAVARARVEAIEASASVDIDALVDREERRRSSAGADAAADLLDLDVAF